MDNDELTYVGDAEEGTATITMNSKGEYIYSDGETSIVFGKTPLETMVAAVTKGVIADVMPIADAITTTDEVPQPQPKKGIKGISILDFFERYRIEPRYQAFESRPRKEGKACSHTWMVIFDKKEGRYLREEGSTRKYRFFLDTDEILDFLKEKAKKQEEDK